MGFDVLNAVFKQSRTTNNARLNSPVNCVFCGAWLCACPCATCVVYLVLTLCSCIVAVVHMYCTTFPMCNPKIPQNSMHAEVRMHCPCWHACLVSSAVSGICIAGSCYQACQWLGGMNTPAQYWNVQTEERGEDGRRGRHEGSMGSISDGECHAGKGTGWQLPVGGISVVHEV